MKAPGASRDTCNCEESQWTCRENPPRTPTPRWMTNTTDVLFDITGEHGRVIDWLLDTHDDFIDARYGGWSPAAESKSSADLHGTASNILVWYNNKADHALPSYLNSIHNAMLRRVVEAKGSAPADYGITTYVHPLLVTGDELLTRVTSQMVTDYGTVLILVTAFGLFPSALIPYLIMERSREEKRVQLVAGVSTVTYWFAKFAIDLLSVSVFIALTVAVLAAFGLPAYTANANLAATVLLLFLFCTAAISMVYCMEKLFSEPSLGQLTVICLNIFIGILTIVSILLLDPMWYISVSFKFPLCV